MPTLNTANISSAHLPAASTTFLVPTTSANVFPTRFNAVNTTVSVSSNLVNPSFPASLKTATVKDLMSSTETDVSAPDSPNEANTTVSPHDQFSEPFWCWPLWATPVSNFFLSDGTWVITTNNSDCNNFHSLRPNSDNGREKQPIDELYLWIHTFFSFPPTNQHRSKC